MPPTGTINTTAKRAENFWFEEHPDPTGNNNPAVRIVAQRADGTIVYPAVQFYEHGTNGFELFINNGCDTSAFGADANGQINVRRA